MAIEKFSTTATTKTHGAIAASFVDLLMPHVELVGSTSNTLRSGVYALAAWMVRGKKDTGSWSLS
jgi:hypothetical protein